MFDPYNHRLLVVVWAFIETSLFGGIMYGWASLVYIAKEDGIYSYLCPQNLTDGVYNETNTTLDGLLHRNADSSTFAREIFERTYSKMKYTSNTGGYNISIPAEGYKTSKAAEGYNISIQAEGYKTSPAAEGYNISIPAEGYKISVPPKDDNTSIQSEVYQRESLKCKAQDSMIALGQTISGSTSFLGLITIGQLHRKLGTKRLRIITWLVFVFGCLCTAFLTNDAPWLMFVTYWTISVVGIGLLTTNIQVSYLYPATSSTVVSLICGGYDFSGSVMLFIKLAHEAGVPLKVSLIVLAGGSVMTIISAICWLPWKTFTKQDQVGLMVEMKQLKEKDDKTKPDFQEGATNTETLLRHQESTADETPTPTPTPALKTLLTSPLFLLHILWYIILQTRFSYLIAFLNPALVYLTDGNTHQVSHFTNVFLYANMSGYVTSFLAGVTYDCQKARYKDSTPLGRSLLPAALPLATTSIISVLVSVLILIPHLEVLYAVFILTTAYRSFLYSIAASFISQVFPAEHFSALYIIMVISGSVVAFVQYALYSWSYAYDGAYTHVCIMLLCLVMLSFIHPIYIVVKCRRETSVPVDNHE